jgi:hypothetical protein
LGKLQNYVTIFGSQIANAIYLSLKIAIQDHIAKSLDASLAIQRTLDILIGSIADAQKGTIPPRGVTPALLLGALRNESPSFPPETTLPFPLANKAAGQQSRLSHETAKKYDRHAKLERYCKGDLVYVHDPTHKRSKAKKFAFQFK